MLHNLNLIIKMQGEVCFVLFLIALPFFIGYAAKRREPLAWHLLWLLVFGCAWRLSWRIFEGSHMHSYRYCAALMYPAVLICGYMMAFFHRRDFRLGKFRLSGRVIVLVMLAAVSVYSVVKILRTHPKPLKAGAEIIRRDCGNASGLIIAVKDAGRLGYYSGVPAFDLPRDIAAQPPEKMLGELKREIGINRGRAERIYAVMFVKGKSREVAAMLENDPGLRILKDMPFTGDPAQHMIILTERPLPANGGGKKEL